MKRKERILLSKRKLLPAEVKETEETQLSLIVKIFKEIEINERARNSITPYELALKFPLRLLGAPETHAMQSVL